MNEVNGKDRKGGYSGLIPFTGGRVRHLSISSSSFIVV